MEKSESIKELATALCKFQGEVGKIKKGETNPFFKSKYASLSDILDVIREPLVLNNLSFVQMPEGEHLMTTVLMHSSGEWIESTYSMTPSKNDPQGLGSVITYQRRYALGAVLGLNIDEDDDGNEGKNPGKKPEQNFAAMTSVKPELTNAAFIKAVNRAKDGDTNVYENLKKYFTLTTTQENEWIKEMGI